MSMYLNAVGDIAYRVNSLGDSIPQADTLTVAGWIKIISDIDAGTAIFERYGNSAGSIWQGIYISPSGTGVRVGNSAGSYSAATEIGVGVWAHIAYVRNGTNHEVFINGVSGGTSTGSPGTDTSPSFAIGGNGVTNQCDAEYAHFRIWEAALTATELAAEVLSAVPVRTSNLWADYRFVAGALTADSSGNSRTLRLNGTVVDGASDPVFDTTAPVLTIPTGSATSSTAATIGATTDVANGTMYAVVDTVTTTPSAAELEAGQDGDGGGAIWSGSQAITTTGAKTFNVTGLSPNTGYSYFIGHKDAAGNFSNIAGGTFTTDQRSIVPSDSATGSDAALAAVSLARFDAGTGADAAALEASVDAADSGTGADAVEILQGATFVDVSDSASGSDAVALSVQAGANDAGAGSDAPSIAAQNAAADAATGGDAPSVAASISATDSGAGADAPLVDRGVSDTATGSDLVSVQAALAVADPGAGNDSPAVSVGLLSSDAGAGTDTVFVDNGNTQLVNVDDSGSGSDGVSVEKTEGLDLALIGRNVRFKPLKKPRQPEAPAEVRKAAPSPLIKALVERAKPRSTGVGQVVVAPAPVAPVGINLPEVRVVFALPPATLPATPPEATPPPPPPPPPPKAPSPPVIVAPPAPEPPKRPKPIAVEMVSVPKAAWDALAADVERFALRVAVLETQLADTKGQLAKARRVANQAQAQLLALQLLEEDD